MSKQEFDSLVRDIQRYLHNATFNMHYHNLLQRRYVQCDSWTRLCLAIGGVLVFVGIKIIPTSAVWTTASGAITLISTSVIPQLRWQKKIGAIESERVRWTYLRNEYLNLWNDTRADGDWAFAAKEFKKLRKKDNEFEKQ